MEDNTGMYLVFGIIGLILAIVVMYNLYRWIFSVKRQLWNQKMQIELLIIIAEKLGADTNNDDFTKLKKANRDIIDLY